MIVSAPVLLFGVAAVALETGRPIFFRQVRPGLGGRPFTLYKLRTMRQSAPKHSEAVPDAARLSAVGRFLRRSSIDELPQLWNVIRGDMSLVGPRPLLMEYLELYDEQQARRHLVRPGITGWAQVNGRNAISWREKFELDIWYVDHRSWLLDAKILWMTVANVVRRVGISQPGHVTAEKFMGN